MAVREVEPPARAHNLSVEETACVDGFGRTKIREATKEMRLAAGKVGRRTLVPRVEAEAFVRRLADAAA